jgi:hypothetical protein
LADILQTPPFKFLLVVFNKSVERHSKKVFPLCTTRLQANERFHQYGLNHRAAIIMETLAMFYNSEEKEVGMGKPDKWITQAGKIIRKQNLWISARENSLLKMQLRSGIKKFNSGVKFDHSSSKTRVPAVPS